MKFKYIVVGLSPATARRAAGSEELGRSETGAVLRTVRGTVQYGKAAYSECPHVHKAGVGRKMSEYWDVVRSLWQPTKQSHDNFQQSE